MLMQDGSRSSHEEGQPHLIGQLQEIFPEQTHENMQRALLVNNDLTGAIDYEVVTKRVAVLDDLRKGLDSVHVMGTCLLDLLQQNPQVQELIFPVALDICRHHGILTPGLDQSLCSAPASHCH